ncbi:hypothetical protein MT418_004361 [Batrachochytrium dendrobatidis]
MLQNSQMLKSLTSRPTVMYGMTAFKLNRSPYRYLTFGSKLQTRHSSHVFPESMKVTTVQKELDVQVTTDDIDILYKALKTPIASQAKSGPAASVSHKLSPEYLQSLHLSLKDVEAEKLSKKTNQFKSLERALKNKTNTPTLSQLTQLIHINAIAKRPKQALESFNHIEKVGLTPDVVAYNHLLDSYSRAGDLNGAVAVFSRMQTAGIFPDLVSFSTLINACVAKRDLNGAFKLYHEMKSKHIQPNQIIYTTLINGCAKTKDFARAWKTFNFMRTEISLPDAVAFNLMIHICSKTEDAERAIDLFKEMSERGLEISQYTLTSLIQACSSRHDYYNESFVLLEQMAASGFVPSIRTYNVILSGAARFGDILRGRLIWNDIVERMREQPLSSNPDVIQLNRISPDEYIYASMLRLYTKAIKIETQKALLLDPSTNTAAPPTLASDPTQQAKDFNLETSFDNSQATAETSISLLESTDTSPAALLDEAHNIWQIFLKQHHLHNTENTKRVQSAYLKLLCTDPSHNAFARAYDFWNTLDPVSKKSIANYYCLITLAMRQSDTIDQGTVLWNSLLEWDAEMEKSLDVQSGEKMTRTEKELLRLQHGRSREIMFKMHLTMANGYALAGKIESAVKVLYDTVLFRYPYYLPAVHFRDISPIVKIAEQNADNAQWDLMNHILGLCPPITDPLSQVQHMLKLKAVPSGSWWGWNILGVDEHAMAMLRRKQQKERSKVVQRTEAYRNRSTHHRNTKVVLANVPELVKSHTDKNSTTRG